MRAAADGPWTLSSLQRDTRRRSKGLDRRVALLPVVHSGHFLARAFRSEYSGQCSAIVGQCVGAVIHNLAVHLLEQLERAWTRTRGGYGEIRWHCRTFRGIVLAIELHIGRGVVSFKLPGQPVPGIRAE